MTPSEISFYGLIGYPVSHSISPLMHNAAFAARGINAEYKLFPLQENEVEPFLKDLKNKNICGLNVTIPYKEKVAAFLRSISEEAKLIGAVNTIKLEDDGLLGFNTDGEGFFRHLSVDLQFNPQGKKIAILGAGGASRAVSVYLCKANPESIYIFDTIKPKLDSLAGHLKSNFKNTDIRAVDSIEDLDIQDADLLVNATPIGMKEADPCIVDNKFITGKTLVYDLIYNPKETRLLKAASAKGAKTSNGLGMLLYQGVRAFEIWTAKDAPVEVMRKALYEGVKSP
ncbi:MAG: shikimate dehydrogenase [Candidatus Omnitrophica bacterium]|nr:shikimate dehydrogenase [Candidatus Omnitrophota bacterium]MBU1870319.1 shikimate dehydrogenase [Candidatus Omnitrophota bacterium]